MQALKRLRPYILGISICIFFAAICLYGYANFGDLSDDQSFNISSIAIFMFIFTSFFCLLIEVGSKR
jgi:hypothetical protein